MLASACDTASTDDQPTLEARVLVGEVDGTDIVLGALVDGDRFAVYQCGGDQTVETHTDWFRGEFDGDAFDIEEQGLRLTGTRSVDGLDGELIEADGTRHSFHIDPVEDDDEAGVYISSEGGLSTGVVVLPGSDGLVAQGASCREPDECFQVIILAPLTIANQQIAGQVLVDGSTVDLEVSRTLVAPDGV